MSWLGRKTLASPDYLDNLFAWYDFSDAATLFKDINATTPVSADGDLIYRVNDKSGNSRYMNAITSFYPKYKLNIQNGKSVAQAVATAMAMQAQAAWVLAQPLTIVVVVKLAATNLNQGYLSQNSTTIYVQHTSLNVERIYAGSAASGPSGDTSAHVLAFAYNSNQSRVVKDGVASAALNPGTNGFSNTANPTLMTLGSSEMGVGSWMAECRVYAENLYATGNLARVNQALYKKWGITGV